VVVRKKREFFEEKRKEASKKGGTFGWKEGPIKAPGGAVRLRVSNLERFLKGNLERVRV